MGIAMGELTQNDIDATEAPAAETDAVSEDNGAESGEVSEDGAESVGDDE